MSDKDYVPTIKIPMAEMVKAWVQGMAWPNGDKVKVKDFEWDVTHDASTVFVQPRCEPATPDQLVSK
jgi:hypothetical protein